MDSCPDGPSLGDPAPSRLPILPPLTSLPDNTYPHATAATFPVPIFAATEPSTQQQVPLPFAPSAAAVELVAVAHAHGPARPRGEPTAGRSPLRAPALPPRSNNAASGPAGPGSQAVPLPGGWRSRTPTPPPLLNHVKLEPGHAAGPAGPHAKRQRTTPPPSPPQRLRATPQADDAAESSDAADSVAWRSGRGGAASAVIDPHPFPVSAAAEAAALRQQQQQHRRLSHPSRMHQRPDASSGWESGPGTGGGGAGAGTGNGGGGGGGEEGGDSAVHMVDPAEMGLPQGWRCWWKIRAGGQQAGRRKDFRYQSPDGRRFISLLSAREHAALLAGVLPGAAAAAATTGAATAAAAQHAEAPHRRGAAASPRRSAGPRRSNSNQSLHSEDAAAAAGFAQRSGANAHSRRAGGGAAGGRHRVADRYGLGAGVNSEDSTAGEGEEWEPGNGYSGESDGPSAPHGRRRPRGTAFPEHERGRVRRPGHSPLAAPDPPDPPDASRRRSTPPHGRGRNGAFGSAVGFNGGEGRGGGWMPGGNGQRGAAGAGRAGLAGLDGLAALAAAAEVHLAREEERTGRRERRAARASAAAAAVAAAAEVVLGAPPPPPPRPMPLIPQVSVCTRVVVGPGPRSAAVPAAVLAGSDCRWRQQPAVGGELGANPDGSDGGNRCGGVVKEEPADQQGAPSPWVAAASACQRAAGPPREGQRVVPITPAAVVRPLDSAALHAAANAAAAAALDMCSPSPSSSAAYAAPTPHDGAEDDDAPTSTALPSPGRAAPASLPQASARRPLHAAAPNSMRSATPPATAAAAAELAGLATAASEGASLSDLRLQLSFSVTLSELVHLATLINPLTRRDEAFADAPFELSGATQRSLAAAVRAAARQAKREDGRLAREPAAGASALEHALSAVVELLGHGPGVAAAAAAAAADATGPAGGRSTDARADADTPQKTRAHALGQGVSDIGPRVVGSGAREAGGGAPAAGALANGSSGAGQAPADAKPVAASDAGTSALHSEPSLRLPSPPRQPMGPAPSDRSLDPTAPASGTASRQGVVQHAVPASGNGGKDVLCDGHAPLSSSGQREGGDAGSAAMGIPAAHLGVAAARDSAGVGHAQPRASAPALPAVGTASQGLVASAAGLAQHLEQLQQQLRGGPTELLLQQASGLDIALPPPGTAAGAGHPAAGAPHRHGDCSDGGAQQPLPALQAQEPEPAELSLQLLPLLPLQPHATQPLPAPPQHPTLHVQPPQPLAQLILDEALMHVQHTGAPWQHDVQLPHTPTYDLQPLLEQQPQVLQAQHFPQHLPQQQPEQQAQLGPLAQAEQQPWQQPPHPPAHQNMPQQHESILLHPAQQGTPSPSARQDNGPQHLAPHAVASGVSPPATHGAARHVRSLSAQQEALEAGGGIFAARRHHVQGQAQGAGHGAEHMQRRSHGGLDHAQQSPLLWQPLQEGPHLLQGASGGAVPSVAPQLVYDREWGLAAPPPQPQQPQEALHASAAPALAPAQRLIASPETLSVHGELYGGIMPGYEQALAYVPTSYVQQQQQQAAQPHQQRTQHTLEDIAAAYVALYGSGGGDGGALDGPPALLAWPDAGMGPGRGA